MPRKKRQRIHLVEHSDSVLLDMGPIEIWDGADLALLRETVTRLVHEEQRQALTFDMSHVKYVPSGFFGLLLDCFDRGVRIQLLRPTEHVTSMLWFQQFFAETQGPQELFVLHEGPQHEVPHDQPLPWSSSEDQEIWDANRAQPRFIVPLQHRQ